MKGIPSKSKKERRLDHVKIAFQNNYMVSKRKKLQDTNSSIRMATVKKKLQMLATMWRNENTFTLLRR